MKKRHYLFNCQGRLLREVKSPVDHWGGAESVVEVVGSDQTGWRLTLDMYYFKDGRLTLEITQPLDRALATFGLLLAADALLHDRGGLQ